MSTNMTLITSVTVGAGGAASVTLPATGTIPATYTDLKVVYSARTNVADVSDDLKVLLNGSSASVYSSRNIKGNGSTAFSQSISSTNAPYVGMATGNNATASTFGSGEFYFPNYTSSNAKSMSSDAVSETNATSVVSALTAYLWNPATQAAITTIAISPYNGTAFAEGSTFYLYGISAVTSTPKATGGIISQDATYWYHTFPFTSTFTPTTALSADILCIAGGGGGAKENGTGGGGAGGLLAFTNQSLSTTAYTVTVGAGGTGATSNSSNGNTGGDSQFGALTLVKGGGYSNSGNGGSGGGAYPGSVGGSATSGQGNAGGNGIIPFASPYPSGGGGGAGAAGQNGSGSQSGAGGIGINTYSSWANATFTGDNGYYAGGGGGGTTSQGALAGAGGLGGGATGGPNNGKPNTGGGGGGGLGANSSNGGSGGSGLVIVRYAK